MEYLLLAIAASVGFSLVLKTSENRRAKTICVAFANYAIGSVIAAAIWLLDSEAVFTTRTLYLGVFAGASWTASLIAMMFGMRLIGVAVTSAVMRLGMVFPIILGALIWAEYPNAYQYAGVAAAALAIVLLSFKSISQAEPGEKTKLSVAILALVLTVWLAESAALMSSKCFEELAEEQMRSGYVTVLFVTAAILTLAWMAITRAKPARRDAAFGVVAGLPNVFMAFFIMTAVKAVGGLVFFPVFASAGTVLLAAAGVVIWREKLGRRGIAGIAFAVAAFILLNVK